MNYFLAQINTPVSYVYEVFVNKIIALLICICCFMSHALHSITQENLLEYAISQNDKELLDAVFRYRGDQDNPSLNLAMQAKDYFVVFMFIEYGVDINSRRDCLGENLPKNQFRIGQGKTVLEAAIEDNEIAFVKYFLLKGADPTVRRRYYEGTQGSNTKTNYVTTAVYDAIVKDRLDTMILFVEHGVNLSNVCYEIESHSSKTPYKMTPIQVAISHNKRDIVALLLSVGVEI